MCLYLAQKDVARRWGISHRTLERWRMRGGGPAYLKLGERVVYRMKDVEAFEERQLRGGEQDAASSNRSEA
jgi:predicted site-specific integrase-resolvase